MPRPLRHDPIGGIHHVMNRGVDRGDVFLDDESRIDFGRRLAEIHRSFAVEVIAYCLMDNHYHLVLRCPSGGLSDAMQQLSAVFTRHVNDRFDRDGPLFRGRFTSRPITTSDYLVNSVRYVHRNALDLPGVRSVEQYRWSSHRAYLGHRRPAEWLRPGSVLDWFDDVDHFHRFVSDDRRLAPTETTVFDPAVVLSSIEFLLRSTSVDGARVRSGDVRATVFAVTDRLPGPSADALIDHLAVPSGAARRQARTRAAQRLESSPRLWNVARDAVELAALDRAA